MRRFGAAGRCARRTALVLAMGLGLVLSAATARAQESGGSFGGSDFGGGGGDFGGGGGGSDWGGGGGGGGTDWGGGGGNSDFGSGSSTTGGGGDLGGAAAVLVFAVVFVFIAIAISYAQQSGRRARSHGIDSTARQLLASVPATPPAYVAALQLAIDWRERAAVQAVLQRLAASGDLGTRAGLDRLLDETLGELGRRQEAIRLAAYFSEATTSLPACEARFRQIAAAERGRFQTEVIRGEASGASRDASGRFVASAEEGQGFVVVTIVIASRMPPPATNARLDRTSLGAVANAMAANTPQSILALEVVWTPAEEEDRMSSAEMQVLFPHLRSVDAGEPALGRATCGFCGGVFAAELAQCPQCGASAPRT